MPEPMSEEKLSEIEARLKAATPGPWVVKDEPISDEVILPVVAGPTKANGKRDKLALFPLLGDSDVMHHNAVFIACSPQDVSDLLGEVRRLQTAVAEEREACAWSDWANAMVGRYDYANGYRDGGKAIAAAIRERGRVP